MKEHSSDFCQSRRRRHSGSHARKERVLHTRISEQLSEDIRRFAEDLRVPASNLVRNVLEEVFTVVDGVSEDVGSLFEDLIEEAEGVRERVRNQSSATGRRRHRSRTGGPRRRRRSRHEDEEDVEAELRRDEAREDGSAGPAREARPGTEAGPATSAEDAERPRAAELFPEILGWQALVLNRDFECGRCARALAAGESAFLGLGGSGLTETALCGRCAGHR